MTRLEGEAKNVNAASFCVSHPAKFNSRIINAFRTRATRVHAYVPPCQHYPRHKRKTPWHPLAQSRATAGNLKQLRVRRAYVRCSSCKTRGNVRSFNENSLNLSENLYIYIYILCISSYFYYPEREFARLIVTLDESRLCWFYLEIRLCSLWIFFFFCYYFRRYFWVEELKIEIDHRFGKVSRTFYSFLFLAKMCFYRRWIYRKYNVSRRNEILQSIWKLREKIVESIYKVRSFLASFPLNKFCDICIKVVSK